MNRRLQLIFSQPPCPAVQKNPGVPQFIPRLRTSESRDAVTRDRFEDPPGGQEKSNDAANLFDLISVCGFLRAPFSQPAEMIDEKDIRALIFI